MVTAPQLDESNLAMPDLLDRIHSRVKQLSQRVHVQAERSTHEWDALRAELDTCLERLREAQQQVLLRHSEASTDCSNKHLLHTGPVLTIAGAWSAR